MFYYHGTPITPTKVLYTLKGHNFCISFKSPSQVKICHEIGQSVMIDNGAFSFWRKKILTENNFWLNYYTWVEPFLDYHTTWAVIPDVIDGSEKENDELINEWPYGQKGSPVWHLNESLGRLKNLSSSFYRICFGSSGKYQEVGSSHWHDRVAEAFDVLSNEKGRIKNWVHMLRGAKIGKLSYPFASVDSTNIARNHHLIGKNAKKMAEDIEGYQPPPTWKIIHPVLRKGIFREGI